MNVVSIIPTGPQASEVIERSISTINAPLGNYLDHVGLPTANLLSPVEERRKVIESLHQVLEVLPIEERLKASYISKFAICVTVGLFDGALSFLWDETVKALRAKVIGFDLGYFYSIASSISSRYRGLRDPAEIVAIGEHDLLEICRRIGLVDDVNHRRLDTVNYFRNHASAAHPNDHAISGIELLGFLENCLRYAICAPIEHSVIQVKRLLDNVRQHQIDPGDFSAICQEVANLPPERIEDILQALFGMFCDPSIGQDTLVNIRGLSPNIWRLVSDDLKYRLGSRFGYYRSNGDVPRKIRVQEFLDAVDGNQYKDDDSLGAELLEKLQFLRSAHYGYNNFYNEYPHAQSIAQSLPSSGLPNAARQSFVKIVSTCFIGNGLGYREGVDENALPYYQHFLTRFSDQEIVMFLHLFGDHEFTGDLARPKCRKRTISLCGFFRGQTRHVLIQSALDAIINCVDLQKVHLTAEYRRPMADLP